MFFLYFFVLRLNRRDVIPGYIPDDGYRLNIFLWSCQKFSHPDSGDVNPPPLSLCEHIQYGVSLLVLIISSCSASLETVNVLK